MFVICVAATNYPTSPVQQSKENSPSSSVHNEKTWVIDMPIRYSLPSSRVEKSLFMSIFAWHCAKIDCI